MYSKTLIIRNSRDDAYNVLETGINWRALPERLLASRLEAKALGFKTSKQKASIILSLLAIGKAKK